MYLRKPVWVKRRKKYFVTKKKLERRQKRSKQRTIILYKVYQRQDEDREAFAVVMVNFGKKKNKKY